MDLMAEEGIRAMAGALPRLKRQPGDLEARSDALYASWLCGTVLGNVGMALHHKLCHTLGGSFNLPHAEVHTVILPHAIAYNSKDIPAAMTRLARALGTPGVAASLYDLARSNGAPYSLRELGMNPTDLDRAADIAIANPYWNPRAIERAGIRSLLQDAYDGTRPT
jgi:maleylacetate reductase